jgi:hypothetical protein
MDETIENAISAVYILDPVKCTKDDWPRVREALKHWAGKRRDPNIPDRRDEFALEEIQRLDRKFSYRAA